MAMTPNFSNTPDTCVHVCALLVILNVNYRGRCLRRGDLSSRDLEPGHGVGSGGALHRGSCDVCNPHHSLQQFLWWRRAPFRTKNSLTQFYFIPTCTHITTKCILKSPLSNSTEYRCRSKWGGAILYSNRKINSHLNETRRYIFY